MQVDDSSCLNCPLLEPQFRIQFCTILKINCALVAVECVKGQGLPQEMTVVKILPLGVSSLSTPELFKWCRFECFYLLILYQIQIKKLQCSAVHFTISSPSAADCEF